MKPVNGRRSLPFLKMQGLGNDFVVLDWRRAPLAEDQIPEAARRLCDRRYGVGSDGLVLVEPSRSPLAAFRMRMFNPDGSEAACGNALRCVARYAAGEGIAQGESFAIDSLGGLVGARLLGDLVELDMGAPILAPADIPVASDKSPVVDETLSLGGREWTFTAVSMGNPHAVFFLDGVTDEHVLGLGPQVERHGAFPRRTNAEFVEVLSRTEVRARVWERGVGETLACGTGACAIGVAGALTGRTEDAVTVHLPGGDLAIRWDRRKDVVTMTGPGEVVFRGEAELP